MIYTVTFNPALDYTIELNTFEKGAVNRAVSEQIFPGGKGINVSVILQRLGVPNICLGFVAGFTGMHIEECLHQLGCNTDFVHLSHGLTRINVKLCADETTDVNARGPEISAQELAMLYEKLDRLVKGDILVLSGAISPSLPVYTYEMICERLQNRGIDIVVDAAGELLLTTLKYRPLLIKPNRTELCDLFSLTPTHGADGRGLGRETITRYAGKLREMGARNVLVSLDSEGALLITEDGRELFCAAPCQTAVNPVGAGDSMLAGFISSLLTSSSPEDALKLGVAAGSATAFSYGLAKKDDILALRKRL